MSINKPRTRVVYFRISEDEFQQLDAFCRNKGARSLSDVARLAVQQLLSMETKQEIMEGIQNLNHQVRKINQRLDDLITSPHGKI